MRIIYNNDIIDDASLSSSTENPNYPVDNIQDSRLSKVFRSTDTENEYIFVNAGGTASYGFMYSENIPEDATVTLLGHSENDFDSTAFEIDMVKRGNWWVANFSEQAHDFWAIFIDFSDTGDPEYIEIGRIFLGVYVQLPNLDYGYKWDDITNSVSIESISGQAYGDKRKKSKIGKFEFSGVSKTQMDNIQTIWDAVENVDPFILLLWANRLDLDPPRYMKFTLNTVPRKRLNNRNLPWGSSLEFKEVF